MSYLSISNNKRPHFLISENKGVKKIAIKHLLSYNIAIKALKDNDPPYFQSFHNRCCSHKNRCIIRNKDSLKTTTKSLSFYNIVTKELHIRDFLISVFSLENIRGYKNKYINTLDKDNMQDKTSSHIYSSRQ